MCVTLSRWEGRLLRWSLHFLCEDVCFSCKRVGNRNHYSGKMTFVRQINQYFWEWTTPAREVMMNKVLLLKKSNNNHLSSPKILGAFHHFTLFTTVPWTICLRAAVHNARPERPGPEWMHDEWASPVNQPPLSPPGVSGTFLTRSDWQTLKPKPGLLHLYK